ncbi:CHAP domain protein [Geminocystis sp. NIES-3708]|uniref:peptidoglycan-binding protein n=1 Tax=Geminocystis sp. NIES-3708 TaxID=1615909 RepID=UPI0005FC67FD|nr:peptidoglycan-binding protein [Geminocystis sp. NIES-3708]BAQ62465.1 CHAP domain protein [Geminocystis sp. NIES-3708]
MDYPETIIKRGSTGEAVKEIQERLGVQQTGVFGPTTESCVSAFQKAFGLEVDGEVGPITWAALFATQPSQDLGVASLMEAQRRVGVKERPLGSNKGPEVDEYLKRAGVPSPNPWCMAFVYYCVDEAAKKLGKPNPLTKTAFCPTLYNWAKEHGRLVSKPEIGDIFLCIGTPQGHYHTGFVNGPVTNNHFSTVEGNSNYDGSANGTEVAMRKPGRLITSCHYVRL